MGLAKACLQPTPQAVLAAPPPSRRPPCRSQLGLGPTHPLGHPLPPLARRKSQPPPPPRPLDPTPPLPPPPLPGVQACRCPSLWSALAGPPTSRRCWPRAARRCCCWRPWRGCAATGRQSCRSSRPAAGRPRPRRREARASAHAWAGWWKRRASSGVCTGCSGLGLGDGCQETGIASLWRACAASFRSQRPIALNLRLLCAGCASDRRPQAPSWRELLGPVGMCAPARVLEERAFRIAVLLAGCYLACGCIDTTCARLGACPAGASAVVEQRRHSVCEEVASRLAFASRAVHG